MKNRLKVKYNDKLNMTKKDDRFNYCEVNKELYYQMRQNGYKGNISIYFIDKNNNEYGFTIDNIDEISEVE